VCLFSINKTNNGRSQNIYIFYFFMWNISPVLYVLSIRNRNQWYRRFSNSERAQKCQKLCINLNTTGSQMIHAFLVISVHSSTDIFSHSQLSYSYLILTIIFWSFIFFVLTLNSTLHYLLAWVHIDWKICLLNMIYL
jgi:hypothetical protein